LLHVEESGYGFNPLQPGQLSQLSLYEFNPGTAVDFEFPYIAGKIPVHVYTLGTARPKNLFTGRRTTTIQRSF
jgi:hypothetical protein